MNRNAPACVSNILVFVAFIATVRVVSAQQPRYKLIDMGTFGGPQSQLNPGSGNDFGDFARVLNNRGVEVGAADTDAPDPFPTFCFFDCNAGHAFWADSTGQLHDLGALPGGGTSIPTWISDNGLITGFSEFGDQPDPLYAGLPQLRAVLWQQGKIQNLGTLENGFQSEANAVNRFGQVVGASTTNIPDSDSMQSGDFNLWGPLVPPYGYQLHAFIWDKENGMQELGPLPGGTNARALLINDRGQVVGHSYTDSTRSPACNYPLSTDSFVWDRTRGMVDLGSLGGTCTLAFNLNQGGQIVGVSNLEGDQQSHGFLWERGKINDLGGSLGGSFTGAESMNDAGEAVGFATLPGDTSFHATLWRQVGHLTNLGVLGSDECSFAIGINSRGQVIGTSLATCDPDTGAARAFLWQNGTMFDLNALIPQGSPLALQFVESINERGEIAGTGIDPSTGDEHAFLLVPCGGNGGANCQQPVANQLPAISFSARSTAGSKAKRYPPKSLLGHQLGSFKPNAANK